MLVVVPCTCVCAGSAYGSSGSGGLCSGGIKGLDDLLQAGLATAGVAHMASALPRPLARLFTSCTIVELQSPNKLVLMVSHDTHAHIHTSTHLSELYNCGSKISCWDTWCLEG